MSSIVVISKRDREYEQMPASGILAIKKKEAPVSLKNGNQYLTAVLHDINISEPESSLVSKSPHCPQVYLNVLYTTLPISSKPFV